MTPAKKARTKKNLTLADVARKCGVSAASISRIERGCQVASPETAAKLARVLGISERKILYPERYASPRSS